MLDGFDAHDLGGGLQFFTGRLPAALVWDAARFDEVWAIHPAGKHVILMPGGPVETPRWQQAYGADYHYTGQTNRALPVPMVLAPLLDWAQLAIDPRLNGMLLNWYEGAGHYIGPHNDSTRDMARGAPIVTVSFGETRVFRLSRGTDDGKQKRDFPAENGAVFVLPYETNLAWKHAVPKSARYRGRRVSVTLRAFTAGVVGEDPGSTSLA
jgi:alkylated DNA repair dioxygenase AlkB